MTTVGVFFLHLRGLLRGAALVLSSGGRAPEPSCRRRRCGLGMLDQTLISGCQSHVPPTLLLRAEYPSGCLPSGRAMALFLVCVCFGIAFSPAAPLHMTCVCCCCCYHDDYCYAMRHTTVPQWRNYRSPDLGSSSPPASHTTTVHAAPYSLYSLAPRGAGCHPL